MPSDSNAQRRVCRRVNFRGRVQGVGFRYTTCRIAQRFEVAGYVRNLPDGSVELVADGEAGVIEAFVAEIHLAFPRSITETVVEDQPAAEPFTDFSVRY